eukprot:CAMPEP_0172618498 /NCGR_PEP_ID=MMETSP1068-20121228/81747_1 /TAXON_ID=35684 /ORGANISM="Pseudopedinella elastica, Strain CCMP716" /LENGTH=268 /DNA_ID=CAMNT_0013424763 /DNA_START=131 /DNA_END=934 /DNA_ORIENTATION=-
MSYRHLRSLLSAANGRLAPKRKGFLSFGGGGGGCRGEKKSSGGVINSLPSHVLMGMAIAGVGDAAAQAGETEGNLDLFDAKRFMGFLAFGALIKGGCQHFVYGRIIPQIGPKYGQFLADQLGWSVLGYYPLYYVVAGWVQHGRDAADSVRLYVREAPQVLPVYYGFWAPVQLVNFFLVPVVWRTTTVMATSVAWLALMSRTHAKIEQEKVKTAETAGQLKATSAAALKAKAATFAQSVRRPTKFAEETENAPSFEESCRSNSECLLQW